MNHIHLLLDDVAREIAAELLDRLTGAGGLEETDGWLKMNARLAADIDALLIEQGYVGCVSWYSESDFIEKEIRYS
ncbi:hypothetical protein AB6E04_01925 [Vibrio amylolyticus]|uniref:hypothetical protein n=1 Tax=Vibrio amylolyticus TaxID=2847292 RepID=UPI00354B4A16